MFDFNKWLARLTCAAVGLCASLNLAAVEQTQYNVLFIAVDDLRTELGCYGSPFIQTPNIDSLAAGGTRFEHSYCQIPLCGPSRASLMSGRYPEKLELYNNNVEWRKENPDVVTLSQHFKNNGYTAIAAGKIYHNGIAQQDDASWNEPDLPFWQNRLLEDYLNPDNRAAIIAAGGTHHNQLAAVPPFEKQVVPDTQTSDGQIAQFGIDKLQGFHASGEPFFLALGFHKPHLSFNAPEAYWDLYDPEMLPDAPNPNAPEGYYDRFYNSSYIRRFKDMPESGPFSEETVKTLRHAYFACVSFVDAQIGKVLDELERLGLDQNTIVVLWGDHGYLLNDHGVFGKHNQFEEALRTPLIISVPGESHASVVTGPVELIDIYPTLSSLASLPIPAAVQGRSQVDALQTGVSVRTAAYAVYGGPTWVLSRSTRTARFRYVEWFRDGAVIDRALFDYDDDPLETVNLVDDPGYTDRVLTLQAALSNRAESLQSTSSVSLTAPSEGQAFNQGSTVTVSANTLDLTNTISEVVFYANGVVIGSDTTSPYTVDWTPTVVDSYYLKAVATNSLGDTAVSTGVNVTVNAAPGVVERVTNGQFNNSQNSWDYWKAASADVTFSFDNQEAEVDMNDAGTITSNIQLYQNAVDIKAGVEYILTFTAECPTGPVPINSFIRADSDVWNPYLSNAHTVTSTPSNFTVKFTSTATDPAARLDFHIGNPGGHIITIDNVSLIYTDGYLKWQQVELADNGVPVQDQGKFKDPDLDGFINLLEYAFGTNPLLTTLISEIISLDSTEIDNNTYFTITFPRRKQDATINYDIGYSSDLSIWDYTGDRFQVLSITSVNQDYEHVEVQYPVPQPIGGSLFFNMRIEDLNVAP